MRKQRFVLDTSAFTNLGKTKVQIAKNIEKLVKLIYTARKYNISCYTTPAIWKELKGMLQRKRISSKLIDKLDAWLIQKTPARAELKVPASFLYEYVTEVRGRFDKGLREAEKAVLAVGGDRPDPIVIKDLRERFKKKIRQGIVDSKEDLDALLLAKELDAGLVSADVGIKSWARKWGIRYIDADVFMRMLREYSAHKK